LKFTAFITSSGIPQLGLTPTIDIWTSAGAVSLPLTPAVTEIGGGFYYYEYAAYDPTIDYFARIDAGAGLSASDRYIPLTNDLGQITAQLNAQDTNISYILGLVQSNFRMKTQTYDSYGHLTGATICIYANKTDAAADTSAINTYAVSAGYTGPSLTSYLVTEV
jgi:hypothetical protein